MKTVKAGQVEKDKEVITLKEWKTNRRQALILDIEKMKTILEDLEQSDRELCKELNVEYTPSKKVLISIINEEGLSDTWRLE